MGFFLQCEDASPVVARVPSINFLIAFAKKSLYLNKSDSILNEPLHLPSSCFRDNSKCPMKQKCFS